MERSRNGMETTKQGEAFDYYYSLGKEERSLQKVAKKFGVSARTVGKWSSKFQWQRRCQDMETEEALEAKETDGSVKNRYKRLLHKLVVQATRDFEHGKLRIKNVADLDRVARLDLALMEVSEEAVGGDAALCAEDRELVGSLLREMKAGLAALRG